jgi:hypothetical protein
VAIVQSSVRLSVRPSEYVRVTTMIGMPWGKALEKFRLSHHQDLMMSSHCVCGGDFSIKDPVAEEVVVCAHTEDLFGGRNIY